MVFYFTGTGNSKWIAETIARETGTEAVNIIGQDPEQFRFTEEDTIGIVFPVYSSNAPQPVNEFFRKIDPNGAHTYAVCSYTGFSGKAMQMFSERIMHLDCGYGMFMPDNTTVMGMEFDTEESALEKLRASGAALAEIIGHIKAEEKGVFITDEGPDPDGTTKDGLAAVDNGYPTEGFHVNKDKCISCGLCKQNCPANVLDLDEDGYPTWNSPVCYWCTACINYCPTEAIEFGDTPETAFRYSYEKYIKLI